MLFTLSTTAYAATGWFNSTYNFTNQLDTRELVFRNNNPTIRASINPTQGRAGHLITATLQRSVFLGWSNHGARTINSVTGGNFSQWSPGQSGTYRIRLTQNSGSTMSGEITVDWTDR